MSIVKHEASSVLALAANQDWWTEKQLAALHQIGVERASNGDLAVFMHVCQRTGLDPFARQIYMIQRDGKQVIQTGIDGMRLVARRAVDRTGEALSIDAPEWCGPDGVWRDVWLADEHPAAARVTVTRGAGSFTSIALWREYVQTKRDGSITRMWATRGAGQLAKCAEALALRKACPQDLSGLYIDDEFSGRPAEQPQRSGLAAALGTQTPSPAPETPAETSVAEGEAGSSPASDPRAGEGSPYLNPRSALAKAMYAAIREHSIPKDDVPDLYAAVTGREVTSSKELTEDEARAVLRALDEREKDEPLIDVAEAELVEDGQ